MAQHDAVAERQVLALVLSGHPRIGQRFLALPLGCFQPGTHETVAAVLRDKITRAVPVDPLTVAADAAAVAGTDHKADLVHRFVHNAATTAPTADAFDYYAEIILNKLRLRHLGEAGHRLAQLAEHDVSTVDVPELVAQIRSTVDDVEAAVDLSGGEPPMSLQDLFDEQDQPHDWLVPNLLERMDRLILTGYEGTGKSHLVAQFALTIAAGLHPFIGNLLLPSGHRVLVWDCENSKGQIKRRYRGIRYRVDRIREQYGISAVDWSKQVRLVIRPEGVDLNNPQENARIEQAIAATAPDLVVCGPLYKMHKQNINDEEAARQLVDALDRFRIKYGFTLIAEAHVGHVGESQGGRKLRPTGSSLFLRWPEFGYGIRAAGDAIHEEHPSYVQLAPWRGARDERDWPSMLKHSRDELPWTPADYDYRHKFGMDLKGFHDREPV